LQQRQTRQSNSHPALCPTAPPLTPLHTQVERDVWVLRQRIAELEADNARLHHQATASGSGDTPRAQGWDGSFSDVDPHSRGAITSPLRANQPAAAVLALAAAAAASARHSMASTHASEGRGGDLPASAAAAHSHLALEPLPQGAAGLQWAQQRGPPPQQPPSATWRRQGEVLADMGAAVASSPPSLRDDFIVAAHRLKVAQRTVHAWLLWACFTSWRRDARARTQSETRAALLLRRVMRRNAATAFRAWRGAVEQHSHRSAMSDGERGVQQHQQLPPDMERLLRTCPPEVKAAFEQQLGLFASSLAAADDATADMQRQHARELGELRQSLQAQTEALGRAVAQLKMQQQQAQRQQYARDALPPVQRMQQGVSQAHVLWSQQLPAEAAMPSPPVVLQPRASISLPPRPTPPAGPSRMSSLLAHASSEEDLARGGHGDGSDEDGDGGDGGSLHVRSSASPMPPHSPRAAASARPPPPPPPPTPLPGYEGPSTSLVSIAQLVIGGWTRHEAAAALAATHGRLDEARAWLEARGSASRAAPPAAGPLGRGVPGTPTTRL
jgi:hypothetical protein